MMPISPRAKINIKRLLFILATTAFFAAFMVVVFGDNDPNRWFRACFALTLVCYVGANTARDGMKRFLLRLATIAGFCMFVAAVFSAHDANRAFRVTLGVGMFALAAGRSLPKSKPVEGRDLPVLVITPPGD